jgi:hypothetical protein
MLALDASQLACHTWIPEEQPGGHTLVFHTPDNGAEVKRPGSTPGLPCNGSAKIFCLRRVGF